MKCEEKEVQNQNLITQLTQQLNSTQNVLQLKPNTSIVVPQSIQIAPRPEAVQFSPVFTAAGSSPPPPTPPASTTVALSKDAMLDELREKAVAIKTCMKLTMEEVEALIFGGRVVRGKITFTVLFAQIEFSRLKSKETGPVVKI